MNDAPKKRRFLRYGLRSFLIVIIALGIFLGWYVQRVEKQKAAVRWVQETGGCVWYDYEEMKQSWGGPIAEPENPSIFGRVLGDDYSSRVISVIVDNVDTIEPLRSFQHVEALYFSRQVNYELTPLKSLRRLSYVSFDDNNVSALPPGQYLRTSVSITRPITDEDLADIYDLIRTYDQVDVSLVDP